MSTFTNKDPHIYHVLMSLRQLKRGKLLIFGPISQAIFLDGSPWIPLHADWLKSMNVIKEVDNDHNLPTFKITALGFSACDMLENWYGSLKLWQKIAIRYWGGHFPKRIEKLFPMADMMFS